MFYTFDDPKQFEGKKTWWMSFPNIESRKLIAEPFGPSPKYKVGDKIRFTDQKTERKRKILKVQWHAHRYQCVYIVETKCSDTGNHFEPYWFEDKLTLATE